MRYGSLIKLRPEWEEHYIILHKHTFPGVLERIYKSKIRNYSIFLHEKLLFSYYEYVGDDFDRDIAKIGEDPVTKDWWKLTDPMQEPLETCRDGEWWARMDEIFHWNRKNTPREKISRMAFTACIMDGFEEKVIESLKIAYPILVETSNLKDIKNFSVYHKDEYLYSYLEFLDADLAADFQKLKESLKVEDEMEWQPMKEIFHTD
jgi:L-rhamnose mutarotase